MNTYFIPTDIKFVEEVAKAIARNRLRHDISEKIQDIAGINIKIKNKVVEESVDNIFEKLWNGNSPMDRQQKANYMNDAIAAISAINLKLITST